MKFVDKGITCCSALLKKKVYTEEFYVPGKDIPPNPIFPLNPCLHDGTKGSGLTGSKLVSK
jgi:hypothetical protein